MPEEVRADSNVMFTADLASEKQIFSASDAEPITEGQFKALARKFDTYPTLEGVVHEREGFPWRFIRLGTHVRAVHKSFPLPEKHYIIV